MAPAIEKVPCPPDWVAYIKQLALEHLYFNAYYAFQELKDRMAAVATAEELGVPSPDPEGRTLAQLQAVLDAGKLLFKDTYAKVKAATTVAQINEIMLSIRNAGHTWLVDDGWSPYELTCNWEGGAK